MTKRAALKRQTREFGVLDSSQFTQDAKVRRLPNQSGWSPSPSNDDRDQAYSNLFNKAIEHDWFAETEPLALTYMKAEPDGPVKPLAQIVVTLARAQAGQF